MKEYTVEDLLSSDRLQGLQVVAGSKGLSNNIGNVNTIENLDSYDWLRAGDFLLTTGYIYKDNPEQLVYMVERLSQINCAGLGFKMQRYFEKLPQDMLDRAEELNFPVLMIPFKYSLSDVSYEISGVLRGADDSMLSRYMSIHNCYNESALSGEGTKGILDTLYSFIHLPVVLVDNRWKILMMHDPEGELAELNIRTKGFRREFIESISPNITGKAKILTRNFSDSSNLITRIVPLEDISSLYGYLIAFETDHGMDWLDFAAFESATVPLVLDRVKAKQINDMKHQLRLDFFDELLQGNITSVNNLSSLAEIHHMDIHKTYMCMIIKLNESDNLGDNAEEQRNQFLRMKKEIINIIDKIALKNGLEVVSIHRANLIISFIQVPESLKTTHSWDIVSGFPELISEELKRNYDVSFLIGIGTPIKDFINLRASYYQADEAIKYMHAEENGLVCYYENFMVDQLLDSVSDTKILENFAEMSVGTLCEYDRQHGTNLIKTLEVYFESIGNMSIAAKELFLHRNSLIYRMDKIKELLNMDFKDANELLTLQVGLRVLKVLESRNYK